jgi:UDP-N-acetylglucosamine 4,6-dehydratase
MAEGKSLFSIFDGRSVLITGGTGSFGRRFVSTLLDESDPARVIVFSRDELKQYQMRQSLGDVDRLRFFLGDVRDKDRLYRAFDGVDFVIHAAALKQIPAAEYNPFEFVKTNILGAQNIIDASIDRGVGRVVALSTDKASSPINLYGATKLVSDKLFVNGNAYSGSHETIFSVVRYGNVVGSRGSVVPALRKLGPNDTFRITDSRMSRFWITLDGAVEFVARALNDMKGGEVFVPKLPSMKLVDMVEALAPQAEIEIIGIRPGEKLHEEMISVDEARRTIDRGGHFVICPDIHWEGREDLGGDLVEEGFSYSSDTNTNWLAKGELVAMLDD